MHFVLGIFFELIKEKKKKREFFFLSASHTHRRILIPVYSAWHRVVESAHRSRRQLFIEVVPCHLDGQTSCSVADGGT